MDSLTFTNDDFQKIHWHDNAIHGFRIWENDEVGTGELILDIDYISEWLSCEDNTFRFKVAPSDLIFHDVSDLVISIDYASGSAALQPMGIHEIHREVFTYPNGYSSFKWKVEINRPGKSFISFHSTGFSQTPRMAPVTTGAQYLSHLERDR